MTLSKLVCKQPTCGNQSELVFLIGHLFLLHIPPGEEKSHHPLEELVHQLDGERNHIDLMKEKKSIFNKNMRDTVW